MPGWVNEIRPTKMTLNNGVRYHLANLDRGLVELLGSTLLTVDILKLTGK